jgi:hypothetical protein
LEDELKEYKLKYEQYRMIKDTILSMDDELEELRRMNSGYKKTLVELFESLKHRLVAKSIKIMDKMDHVFYVNGALGAYQTIIDYMQGSLTDNTGEKVSLITGKKVWLKPVEKRKK